MEQTGQLWSLLRLNAQITNSTLKFAKVGSLSCVAIKHCGNPWYSHSSIIVLSSWIIIVFWCFLVTTGSLLHQGYTSLQAIHAIFPATLLSPNLFNAWIWKRYSPGSHEQRVVPRSAWLMLLVSIAMEKNRLGKAPNSQCRDATSLKQCYTSSRMICPPIN